AERLRQGRRARGVLHADQPADAGQREAERQLDRRELAEDQQQQREAGFAVRVQQRDRFHVDREHLQLGGGGIAVLVDRQITAALDDAGVERQADAVRRLERERDRRAAAEVELEQHAEPVDRSGERSERDAERCRDLDRELREAAALRVEAEVDQLQLERPGGQRRNRQARVQPGAVEQAQLAGGIGLRRDVEPDRDAVAEDKPEERVGRLGRRL